MSAVDTMELLLSYLGAQSTLTTAVTTATVNKGRPQIYGPPGVPDGWTLSKAVVCLRQHGTASLDLPLGYQTFQIRCYAPKSWQASQLFTIVQGLLHRRDATFVPVQGGEALLQFGQLTSGPVDSVEPETNWPFVLGMFLLHLGEMVHT